MSLPSQNSYDMQEVKQSSFNHEDTYHMLRLTEQEVGRKPVTFLHPGTSYLPLWLGLRYLQPNAFLTDILTKTKGVFELYLPNILN